ncbi:hypothetical protein ElyMa_000701300 [Elysia marginata]|uniref:C-type lectin domain-containing protein n=1 Tax=Elysia marginata TaxID=1093978 RepID=A0AAV4GIV7_9GAST|nr:hypothetical protein ElyMa_000701300 [Elysia marginata]
MIRCHEWQNLRRGRGQAWLGGLASQDAITTTNFTWLSDQALVSVPVAWWSSAVIPQSGSSDDLCLLMTTAATLDGQTCGDTYSYVCQIYAGDPCDSFLPGAQYHDETCLLPLADEVSFDTAVVRCFRHQEISSRD